MTSVPTVTLPHFQFPVGRLPIVEQISRQVAEPILRAARRPMIDPGVLTRAQGVARDFQRVAESVLPQIQPVLLDVIKTEQYLKLTRAQTEALLRPLIAQFPGVQFPAGWGTRPLRRPDRPTPFEGELGIGRYDLVRGSELRIPRRVKAVTDYAMDDDQLFALIYAIGLALLWVYGPEAIRMPLASLAGSIAGNRAVPLYKVLRIHRRNGS